MYNEFNEYSETNFAGTTGAESPQTGPVAYAERGTDFLALLAAAGLGATAMYLLDPGRGSRRRHLIADKISHAAHVAGDAVETTRHDLANRARGIGAVARRRFETDEADDVVLRERVRSELGRAVSHAGAITATAEGGRVTLSGPVLSHEADELIAHVRSVRGVQDVEDRLERHESAENVPSLQGGGTAPARRAELLQESWTPALRLLGGITGGALAAAALRQRQANPVLTALGLAGAALFLRSTTNVPLDRMVGVGAGRRAVNVQKSVNIAAPIDEVYGWITEWERFPEWMTHVREVRASGERGEEGERTHWVVDGPLGKTVSWDAVTTDLVPRQLVAWKTVEGSPIAHSGRIRLTATDDGYTRVDVHLTYNPIAGAAGHAIASLFGRDPKRHLDDELARLKATIETGRAPHDAAVRRAELEDDRARL